MTNFWKEKQFWLLIVAMLFIAFIAWGTVSTTINSHMNDKDIMRKVNLICNGHGNAIDIDKDEDHWEIRCKDNSAFVISTTN